MISEALLSDNIDRDEPPIIQSHTEQFLVPTSTHHPCQLRFDCNLAKTQRQQYDKDMNRVGPSKYVQFFSFQDSFICVCLFHGSTIKVGGVLLHGCANGISIATDTQSYPSICVSDICMK